MSELREVLDAITHLAARGEPMALATVVATEGSTYRRAGARLLVPSRGEPIGNISGGCLEGEVARIGRDVMASGEPRTVAFDMTADDDAVWGYGLGCNGMIEVFVEPAAGAVETAAALRQALDQERAIASVTVLDGPRAGTRWLTELDDDEAPRIEVIEGERRFVEPMRPPLRLVVAGAGHDAIPLVRSVAALGWRVVVTDVRRKLLTEERFPDAQTLHADPAQLGTAIRPDARTCVLLMSHNYLRDQAALRSLLGRPLAYLGVLGPRGRTDQMLRELDADGVRLTENDRRVLHAPAGLDIGAEGAEEVAAAIVAELLAVAHGRAGGALRDRSGPIHDR